MESTANNKKVKFFRSKQEIKQLLQDWEKSGKSVKAFCAGLDISPGTFYYWKGTYAKANVSVRQAGFAPLEIVPGNGLFAEVGRIKLYQVWDNNKRIGATGNQRRCFYIYQ